MKKILYILMVALLFQGCEKFLDKVEDSTGMTDEMVFTDYLNTRRFADRMYKDINNYLADYDYSFIAAVCDEGYAECDWETLPIVQTGDWLRAYDAGQALQFYQVWGGWQSIRIANLTIANVDRLEGNATQQQIDEIKGQAYFMRAWYYYEFLRRQGGMPYLETALLGTDNFALPRLSFHETALKIAEDCDRAAAILPSEWDIANIGRPTKGAAMALKASALLFAASPTNNEDNEVARWTAAAQAAWDLISMAQSTGIYKLLESNGTDQITYDSPTGVQTITYPSGYDSIFMFTAPTNEEIIWEHYNSINSNNVWRTFTPKSLATGGIIQGFSVSQNIVDMFETENGLKITDDPAYDPQNPFVDRDPRFYHTILFNRERWTSKSDTYLELYQGGRDVAAAGSSDRHYCTTGYLARKFWARGNDMWGSSTAPTTHVIYFRYAEILLMYAEACNEINGPDYALPGATMTAVEAVNMVRNRVGMPDVATQYLTDKTAFRARIKNERAIELFLEGKRFFDLSRWGDAHKLEHRAIYGASFTPDPSKPTGFTISRSSTPVFTLTFEQKHYRWPIRTADALMFKEFKQNPGW
ncbi:MAG: RagB/SusD family nutrient uptake outer membrane protein [Bacteroidales bacterium]|jgi:hypothetical protein|nr:RagB/SusD family nutrient uptake outer membrane protein [Bacteroidales bacterium]